MSMISEQVKYLREFDCFGTVKQAMLEAADTIKALSAKLAAANMERSDRYYGGGWIDFNDKLPENEEKVLLSKNGETLQDLFEFYFPDENCDVVGFLEGESARYDGFAVLSGNKDNIKWRPLPEPYRP